MGDVNLCPTCWKRGQPECPLGIAGECFAEVYACACYETPADKLAGVKRCRCGEAMSAVPSPIENADRYQCGACGWVLSIGHAAINED